MLQSTILTPVSVNTALELQQALYDNAPRIVIQSHLDFTTLPVPSNGDFFVTVSEDFTVVTSCTFVNNNIDNVSSFTLAAAEDSVFYSDGADPFYVSGFDTFDDDSDPNIYKVQPDPLPPDPSEFLAIDDIFIEGAAEDLGIPLSGLGADQPATAVLPPTPPAPLAAPAAQALAPISPPRPAALPSTPPPQPAPPAEPPDAASATSTTAPQTPQPTESIEQDPSARSPPFPSTISPPADSSKQSDAVVIGGAVAAVIAALCVAVLIACYHLKRAKKQQAKTAAGSKASADRSTANVPPQPTPGPPMLPLPPPYFQHAQNAQHAQHGQLPAPYGAPHGGSHPAGYVYTPGYAAGHYSPYAYGAMGPWGGHPPPPQTPPVPVTTTDKAGGVGDRCGSEGAKSQAAHGKRPALPRAGSADTSLVTTVPSEAPSAGVHSRGTSGADTSVSVATSAYNTAVAAGETSIMQRKERLMTELDGMRARDEQFLGRFAVLPWTERREGGQGVVQCMRSTRTEQFVAVKFFCSRAVYDTELQLYKVDVLRSMMPAIQMEMGNADGAARNSRGYPWPPCIVLEKGESLQEWKAKTQPEFSTIIDALCLITQRLEALHGSGWVHRDLKPGNVLRLPGQHSWTLMDFGCAARADREVSLTFTPSYAPPEVAMAAERGDRTIVADAAADMWALGLMAFELLTGGPVFPPMSSTREAIWAQLCGRELLPWEEGVAQQAEKLAQLRGLRRAILQCLQRKPEDRPSATQ
eukprot:jgi/Ulvmu1/1570/UM110_0033.1